jgi:hypothetical protein
MQEKVDNTSFAVENVVEVGYTKKLPKIFGVREKVVENMWDTPKKDVNNRSDVRKSRQKELG